MTELTKPVVRRVGGYVVTMAPEGLYIRKPRQRSEYGPFTYSHLELTLAKLHADAARPVRKRRHVARGFQIK